MLDRPHGAERHALHGSGRTLAGTLASRAVHFLGMFGFYAMAARALAVEAFGVFMLGIALVQLAAALARRGLDQALLASSRPQDLLGFAGRKVAVAAMATGALGACVLFAAGVAQTSTLLFCLALLPVALGQLMVAALRAEGDVVHGNLAEAMQAMAAFAFGVVAWQFAEPAAFVLAWLLSWSVSLGYAGLRASTRKTSRASTLAANVDAQRALLAAGGSMAGVYLLGQAAATLDGALLGLLASMGEVARYMPAQRIAAAFALLHSAFAVAAGPTVRHYLHDRALLQRYLRMLVRLSTALSLPLAVAALGVPGWLPSLFGEAYAAQSGTVLRWLTLAALAVVVTGPLGNLLLSAGHAPRLLRLTLWNTALLAAMVALLAPRGAEAVALGVMAATFASRATLVAATWQRLGVLPFGPALLALLAAGSVGAIVVRVCLPSLGAFAAIALGIASYVVLATLVLMRTHDLRFLRDELVRRGTD